MVKKAKVHEISKSLEERMLSEAKCIVEVKSLQTKLKERLRPSKEKVIPKF